MDLILDIADDVVLDKFWATILPLSAFSSVNGSSVASSQWSQLVSHLPRPQVSIDDYLYEPSSPYSYPTTFPDVSAWPRSYVPRQMLSITIITLIGVHIMYFLFATLSYYFIFNHDMMRHPRFLKNQVKLEIQTSLKAFPVMMLLTLPIFQAEVMGWSKLYKGLDTYGYTWLILSIPCFVLFTDYCIYWIHRWLHIPVIYKALHKPHHKWIVPTPFASYAFHPVDGWLQSVPYHLFVFVFPMHRIVYLSLFVGVTFWTILIHDSDMITGHPLEKIINGPAHHTLHHIYFTVNYGQYFTWADRVGNSYRHPDSSLDPLLEVQMQGRAEREAKSKAKAD